MKNKTLRISVLIFLIFSLLPLQTACRNRSEPTQCFPYTQINVVLNLNLPLYFKLQSVGGWIYTNEQSDGTRGLIIVRTTNGFKIYDRNAPHLCPDHNTTLEVKEDIKITCPKDGAEWILLTGQPIKTANIPPKTYPYTYNPSTGILSIYN